MSIDLPNLDHRSYDDLIAEALRRITRFAPEWTDLNPSDPGITLVELFCWLAETVLYETNRVPELAYLKFLQLLGMRQRPARAAEVELTFTPIENKQVEVPRGTQAAAMGDRGEQVVFETDHDLALIPHALTHIVVKSEGRFQRIQAFDQPAPKSFHPLGCEPMPGDTLYLGFGALRQEETSPVGDFPEELRLHVTVPGRGAAAAALAARAPEPPVKVSWEYLTVDREPPGDRKWCALPVLEDGTRRLTQGGYLVLGGLEAVPALAAPGLDVPRYWLRCRLVEGRYPPGRVPVIAAPATNTVHARNLATVREEPLGVSEGHPDELYPLLHRPVAEDSVTVVVRPADQEVGEQRWAVRADLLSSGPDDRHVVLEPTKGVLTFGDGRRGRVPPVGAEVVAVEYRHGGGRAGNVRAKTVTTLVAELPEVALVTNYQPAIGGADRQSLDELREQAATELRHQRRAVTAGDYAALAREVLGVIGAVTLPETHPDHPGVKVPGAVTVVVAAHPDVGGPAVHGRLLSEVCRHLDEHRLLATELWVRQPRLVPVDVEVTLEQQAPPSDVVRQDVEEEVRAFFSPFTLDRHGAVSGAAFGRSLRCADLTRDLLEVPGVLGVEVTITANGEEDTDDVLLDQDELPSLRKVHVDGGSADEA
ncbi:MAG: putative baseplate assembly protein [Saccharothrix sp.]|nr:putative baseplate assembly protein [Saccharothrix sp.]